MKLLSNAKINLGLNIVEKREDGFHNLESVFLPVPWCDEIEISESSRLVFNSSGIEIDGNPATNLCLKAYDLIKSQFDIPPVNIQLKKQIPIGAGLGGGSSNAAFVLKALSELFKLNIEVSRLEVMADQLGSDCAFFIRNKAAFVSGKGELLNHNFKFNLKTKCILVNPNTHISTKEAYAAIQPKQPTVSLQNALQLPLTEWQNAVVNDFEAALLPNYPKLVELKKQLQAMGAQYVSMSGSGSSFFAFFKEEPTTILFDKNYQWKSFELII